VAAMGIVIPSYVMRVTLVIFNTRYDFQHDTYGAFDGLEVYPFNVSLEMMFFLIEWIDEHV
jgi:hypothetical protein